MNIVDGRLGLDHDRVLGGRYAFPIMSRYVVQNGGQLSNNEERDRLIYWYVHSFLWGRFTGSTESVLNQDLGVMEEHEGALDRLIEQLQRSRGDLKVRPEDFDAWSLGARFYPMLYLLTRVGEAQDWGNGLPLKANLRGRLSQLNVHHIFPRSRLYDRGFNKSKVNALGNFCFLTQNTNLQISNRFPIDYFPEIERNHPGALASQWIPMDEQLWKMENFEAFLEARQELLANAANAFLNGLLGEEAARVEERAFVMERDRVAGPVEEPEPLFGGSIDTKEEEDLLIATNIWVTERGLPEGEMLYELVNSEGKILAYLDLAWPEGLQTGYSEPTALLINEDAGVLEAASAAGYMCFTDPEKFRAYVERDILALETSGSVL